MNIDPNVKYLDLTGCAGLTALPELPSVEYIYLIGCTGLTMLPELPAGCHVVKEHDKSGARR